MKRSKYKNFVEICRINTGSHMMDSGGDKGRHHQQPLPPKHPFIWSIDDKRKELYATIPLPYHLDAFLKLDKAWNEKLDKIEKKDEDLFSVMSWADYFEENLGYKIDGKCDNTYNYENDLSQDFQFCVLMPEGSKEDWMYSKDAIILIQTHNGADIRGGYSPTFACKLIDLDNGYNFLETRVGWNVDSDNEKLRSLSEKWEIGYSNDPTNQMLKDVAKILTKSSAAGEKCTKAKVKLESGETVNVSPYAKYEQV